MKNHYDVVIVGAGPSGAATAKGLSNEGLNVLVLETKKLPRYKICSGIIFKRSQELTEKHFGKVPESAYVEPRFLKGVRLWSDHNTYADWPFDKDSGGAPNIWRSEYDYWLMRNSGANVWDHCELKRFKDLGSHIQLDCKNTRNDKALSITCTYLVGAEGSNSFIRKALDPILENSLTWFIANQYYYEGNSDLDSDFYHGFLEPQYGEVYAWFSVKDRLQIFGTAVKKGNKLLPYINNYTEMLKKRFCLKLKKMVRKSGCMGNNMCSTGKFSLGKGHILLVGEAAGFLNAFGEGISGALSSGFSAAEAITKSFRSDSEALSVYTALTKRERRQTTLSWKLGAKIAGRNLLPS
ncbi:MAG: NAD(P)/FAD-dependent oxidoreductase [Candidatus Brocadiaceae bacterium]|nr:NAD(P)/FAD-dependent oxidoreductase [Candidatus Brocadiaceae bacterium]